MWGEGSLGVPVQAADPTSERMKFRFFSPAGTFVPV